MFIRNTKAAVLYESLCTRIRTVFVHLCVCVCACVCVFVCVFVCEVCVCVYVCVYRRVLLCVNGTLLSFVCGRQYRGSVNRLVSCVELPSSLGSFVCVC